jgi:subtilisin family serine protease
VLADLAAHGEVLDVVEEINAVTLRAPVSALDGIRRLSCVAGANPDAKRFPAAFRPPTPGDFSAGANHWSLDAINVTDFGGGRTVPYDGEGVYVAVIDSGLVANWREYFPEERIATQFAAAFSGGGGIRPQISTQPNLWEHDSVGHGTWVVSVLLGFRYHFQEPSLPPVFNGVAPKATIIPIKDENNNSQTWIWSSVATRAVVYVTNLKLSGALGDARVVINMSQGGFAPDFPERAAIDRAISNGIVYVAAAGNEAEQGMRYPGAHASVISAGATSWVRAAPLDDPTLYAWVTRDVPEADASEHVIAPFSAWELPGQDLDVAAPGFVVPVAFTADGRVDYSFFVGTSASTPHVTGVVALLLQKNPTLTAAQIETILESTAMPLPPACRDARFGGVGPGPLPTLRNQFMSAFWSPLHYCWPAEQASGLLQADAALAATPLP